MKRYAVIGIALLILMAGCISKDAYVDTRVQAFAQQDRPISSPVSQLAMLDNGEYAQFLVFEAPAAPEPSATPRPSATSFPVLTEEQKAAIQAKLKELKATPAPISIPPPDVSLTPISYSGSRPRVALTFDDGPSGYTPQILRILKENGARASFCVLGNRVSDYSGTIQKAIEQGCEIISHTYSHKNLTKISESEIRSQMQMANSLIEQVTGAPPRFLRPPYGSFNDQVARVALENGMQIIKWTIDTRDWDHRDANKIYNAIMKDVRGGSIILCHDLYQCTAEAMERVIPDLIAMGYELVTVSELYGFDPVQ